jgi:hypothetical protein
MGIILGTIVFIVAVVALVSRSTPRNDQSSLVAWYDASGRQSSQSTEQLFDQFLSGLNHSKVDNGGPGILKIKPMCQEGATSIRRFLSEPPPITSPLRTAYIDLMDAGSHVFAHCLLGIATTQITASKHDVTVMLAEMTTYSTMISSYEHQLNVAHL